MERLKKMSTLVLPLLLVLGLVSKAQAIESNAVLSSGTDSTTEMVVRSGRTELYGVVLPTNTIGSFINFIDSSTAVADAVPVLRVFWSSGSSTGGGNSAGAFGEKVIFFDHPIMFRNQLRTGASACQTFTKPVAGANPNPGFCYTVLYREVNW